MDDQRHIGHGFDRADAFLVEPALAFLLQMHIADRDRHRIDAGFAGEPRRLVGVGAGRRRAAIIADKADLALAGDAGLVRHLGDRRRLLDVLVKRFA